LAIGAQAGESDRGQHRLIKGEKMDSSMVRIICAVLAICFIGLIVVRRRNKAE
jgi:hypothetical protein